MLTRLPAALVASLAAFGALAPAGVDGAASAPTSIIYADSGRDYSIVLKAEAGKVFLMAASVRAYCGNTELDFENTGRSFFSGILEPGGGYGNESGIKFKARRHAPVGDSTSGIPRVNGELPIYFDQRGPLEVLLRVPSNRVSVRGSVDSGCRGGRGRIPLFGSIQVLRRGDDGHFERSVRLPTRRLGHGIRVDEAISIHGDVSRTAIDGVYRRVRGRHRGSSTLARCNTGPLRFHAPRYLPVHR